MKKITFFVTLIIMYHLSFSQILVENFEGNWTTSPVGWYQEEVQSGTGSGGSNQYWKQDVYSSGWADGHNTPSSPVSDSSVAWYNDYDAKEGQIDRLLTNDIDLSTSTNPVVSFFFYYKTGSHTNFKFIASKDGGSTWDDISGAIEPTGTAWKQFSFHLPDEYKVSNARIGFEWTAYYGSSDLYLDSVVVFDAPPALSGIKTIDNTQPTAGNNYNSFTDAFSALNVSGVGTGGVVFQVVEGQIFAENPPELRVTGTSANQIIFVNSGTSGTNNPQIQSEGTGSSDYSIELYNSSFVTFNGIDIICKNSNINSDMRLEYGLILNYQSTNNTFKNLEINLNKGNSNFTYGIFLTKAGNHLNTFDSLHVTDCATAFYLGKDNGYDYDTANVITNCSIDDLTYNSYSSVVGIDVSYQKNLTISNNTIENITCNQSPAYGILIHDGYSTNATISDNLIQNISHSASSARFVSGIYISYGDNTICRNEISNISNALGDAVGIFISAFGTTTIYDNEIHNLEYTGTSTYYATGINANQGSSSECYIYNNIIYKIIAKNAQTSTSKPVNTAGIYLNQGENYVYYNSVLLNDTVNNADYKSAAFFINKHYTDIDFRNNIFANKTSGTFALAAAFYHSSTDYSDIQNISNNNLYFADTNLTNSVLFFDGTNNVKSLQNYKSLVSNFDEFAVFEDINFMNETLPYDLHVKTNIVTQIESAGTPITTPIAVSFDFDENARNSSTPDIGAFEADYLQLDNTAPQISYNKIANTLFTGNYILSDFATITDATGVDTVNKPRLYFKRFQDSSVFSGNTSANNGWKYVEADNSTSPFSFTIDYSLLYNSQGGSGSVNKGDIIVYFVVAQDSSDNHNVTANPDDNFTANSVSDITTAPVLQNFFFIGDIFYDFETTDDQDFTHEASYGSNVDEWEHGTPTGGTGYPTNLPSGTKCWGTDLDSNYLNGGEYVLYSPLFEATDSIFMFDFAEFLNIENQPFDSVTVEFQINNYLWYEFGTGYARQDTSWSHQVHYVSVNQEDRIRIAWHFYSDNFTSYSGWFIDDLMLRGAVLMHNVNFTVVDKDSNAIAYPHIWIDDDTSPWYGNDDGTKAVPVAVGTHTYKVNGPHEDYLPAIDTFTIVNNDTNIYIVLLKETFDLTFVVTDMMSSLIEGADVFVNGNHYTTDSVGKVVVTGLEPDTYTYSVSLGNCTTVNGNVNLTEDKTENVMMPCPDDIHEIQNVFSIYPNPVTDFVNVSISDNYLNSNIEIIDISGNKILSTQLLKNKNIIDLKNVKSGVYFMIINSNERTFTQKIIIE